MQVGLRRLLDWGCPMARARLVGQKWLLLRTGKTLIVTRCCLVREWPRRKASAVCQLVQVSENLARTSELRDDGCPLPRNAGQAVTATQAQLCTCPQQRGARNMQSPVDAASRRRIEGFHAAVEQSGSRAVEQFEQSCDGRRIVAKGRSGPPPAEHRQVRLRCAPNDV